MGSSVWGGNRGGGGLGKALQRREQGDREWDSEQWHLGTRGADKEQPDGRDSHPEIPERETCTRRMVNRVPGLSYRPPGHRATSEWSSTTAAERNGRSPHMSPE